MARIIAENIPAEALAPYTSLTRRQLADEKTFIAESVKVIEAALDAGVRPISLLCERRHVHGKAAGLIARLGDAPVYTPADEDIQKLTGYELHRGVLCLIQRPEAPDVETVLRGASCCAVLENARDETNLGAVFRSAAALGVDAVLLSPGSADPLSRRSARVSMGAMFRVPFARIGELDAGGVALLKSLGFTVCALALTDQSRSLAGFTCPRPALLLGNEGEGLKQSTLALCDVTLRIPMHRGMDSLNLSVAAAVAFWEILRSERQRP